MCNLLEFIEKQSSEGLVNPSWSSLNFQYLYCHQTSFKIQLPESVFAASNLFSLIFNENLIEKQPESVFAVSNGFSFIFN